MFKVIYDTKVSFCDFTSQRGADIYAEYLKQKFGYKTTVRHIH